MTCASMCGACVRFVSAVLLLHACSRECCVALACLLACLLCGACAWVGVSGVRVLVTKPSPSGGCSEVPCIALQLEHLLGSSELPHARSSKFLPKCQPGECNSTSASPPSRCSLHFLTDCSARQVDTAPRRCDLTKFAPRSRFSWRVAPTSSGARRRFSCCAGRRATLTRSCA